MSMKIIARLLSLALVVVCGLGIWCSNAFAQGAVQASIAGVVRDSSGAVLPGVTVEASSPVLIEKSRTAVSDGTGRYRIIALNPGTYTITFTLAGFQHREARRGRAHRLADRDHRRRDARRIARRDGDGQRREPDRRRAEHQAAARHR